jgi:hypothetical protein
VEDVTTAREIRENARRVITLPATGYKIEIRALSPFDFAKFGEIPLPDEVTEPEQDPEQEGVNIEEFIPPEVRKGQIRTNMDWAEDCVVHGVTRPRVVKAGEDAGTDGVYASDFKQDWEYVVDQILELSGMKGDNLEPFPEQADAVGAGSDREAVRDPAPQGGNVERGGPSV